MASHSEAIEGIDLQCRICGNGQGNTSYNVREMMFGTREEFLYFQCAQCGCLQINEFPNDMARHYPAAYYSLAPISKKATIIEYLRKKRNHYALNGEGLLGRTIFALAPNVGLRALSVLPLGKETKIIDLGCGSGAILHALCELEFQNLLGVDSFIDDDIVYENGLQVRKAFASEIEGKSSWDVVMMHHSFEHMYDQQDVLENVHTLLLPGAMCMIRIPIVSSFAWEKYKTDWVQLDAPRHFYLHSVNSLEIIASKCGFELEKVVYDSCEFQFEGSEKYKKDISLFEEESGKSKIASLIGNIGKKLIYRRRARKLNAEERGDQAVFYLRKL